MSDSDTLVEPPPPSAANEPLNEVADRAVQYVCDAVAEGQYDFEGFEDYSDGIVVKNAEGVVVYSNRAHAAAFTPGSTPVGRCCGSYLDPPMARRSELIEQLVLDGVPYVECEHSGFGPDGSVYRVQTHKRSLRKLDTPGFALLAVVRVIERTAVAATGATRAIDLAAACERFRLLSKRDQEICRQTALGVSSRELGEALGMTTRGIELRKQKAFAKLGVAKAVDLARLLVRLQDRGFLDLGV
ncbi:PAS domain-containing protein [Botrimarina sp.]|uniref:PAS domain-containing protein n=1 Tax=Botrimarina sp. TaxID=2795802 RepID=UPI0032ED253F